MSDVVTWVELLDVDPSRAFRLREEAANEAARVAANDYWLLEMSDQCEELKEEVRALTIHRNELECEVNRLRGLCREHNIDPNKKTKDAERTIDVVPIVARMS